MRCAAGQACEPSDRQCYRTGGGLCDPCTVNAECSADGTDSCLQNLDTGEHFCASPCQQECPPGYTCTNVQDRDQDYCAPTVGTCIDRCRGVNCGANLQCNPLNGQCEVPPCALNTDCAARQYCGRSDGQCHPTGNGRVGIGGQCGADAECVANAVCVLGGCAAICDDQNDCAGGLCVNDLLDQNRLVCFNLPIQ